MSEKFASYIVHIVCELPSTDDPIQNIVHMDIAFDALANHPRLWSVFLGNTTARLERYLQLRPERYDQVVQWMQQGRLEMGAWFVPPTQQSIEGLIRNLQLGLETTRHLGMHLEAIYAEGNSYVAQLVRGVGLDTVLSVGGFVPSNHELAAIDGSRVHYFVGYDQSQPRDKHIEHAVDRHVLVRSVGTVDTWLHTLSQFPLDDAFFSSYAGFTKAARMHHTLTTEQSQVSETKMSVIELHDLQYVLEPLTVLDLLNRKPRFYNPQNLINSLWRGYFLGKFDQALFDSLLQHYGEYQNPLDEILTVESDGFKILACKRHAQDGIIVRGYNPYNTEHPTTITFNKHFNFTKCDILRLDERRGGATLPMLDYRVQFTSNPHRLLTLWVR